MTSPHPHAWRTALDDADRAAVRALAADVGAADGVGAFSEPTLLDVAGAEGGATRHLLVHADGSGHDGSGDGALLAYAHLDESDPADRVVEFAVTPTARGRGLGAGLADALVADLERRDGRDGPDGPAAGRARAWAHGDLPAAARLAARHGLRRDRDLWMMRRGPEAGPLPERPAPTGVSIGPLRVGVDEADVVAVNGRAFARHPEQGSMSVDDVLVRESEPWFDADGFLLARDAVSGELLGFHWTKVHPASGGEPGPVGEVYVVGVDPGAQGRGLGGALTLAGLHHLAGRGLATVILYVEGDNAAAVATYTRLGFVRAAIDVSYAR